jgi:hypothetical protein
VTFSTVQAVNSDPAPERLYHTPAGPSTKRPDVTLPAIDRRALMANAHRIARAGAPYMASYREALAYGLRAAWGVIATRCEFAAVRARVAPVTHTAEQIAASAPLRAAAARPTCLFDGGERS